MCSPKVLVAATVGQGISKAFGAASKARAERRALRHQAELRELNASAIDAQAAREIAIGRQNAGLRMAQGEQIQSREMADAAGRGIDINSEGTMDSIAATIDWATNNDVDSIQEQARYFALGLQGDAGNMRIGAAGDRAKAAAISPTRSFLGSMLNTAVQVGSMMYGMGMMGGAKAAGASVGTSGLTQSQFNSSFMTGGRNAGMSRAIRPIGL